MVNFYLFCLWFVPQPASKQNQMPSPKSVAPHNPLVVVVYSGLTATTTNKKFDLLIYRGDRSCLSSRAPLEFTFKVVLK
jgi:hypothetical protein